MPIGFLETTGFTPAMVALDAMEKSANVRVLQSEINDFLGIVIKITGSLDDVQTALRAGGRLATQMEGSPVTHSIANPLEAAKRVMTAGPEFNPLIQQDVVHFPADPDAVVINGEDDSNAMSKKSMKSESDFALGFIETQGFTAVFEAIDTACKAADVEVVGKEKLGGGYVTVIIRGDVAAVQAAVDSGSQQVENLGKLIAAHVISRPSASVLSLLPG